MKLFKISMIFLLSGLLFVARAQAQQAGRSSNLSLISGTPVFQVDYPNPTADKPQSKIWYTAGCWWALLPRSGGPSLWQRTESGWKEHVEVNKTLQGVPGRADVWVSKDGITAVGVTSDSLVIFRLSTKNPDGKWNTEILASLKPPTKEYIETATIARDSKGEWWVAADGTTAVYTWHSTNGKNWSPAILLKDGISKDDISVITAMQGAVMITWSNQQDEAVQCRVHIDGQAASDWQKEEIVQSGNKTADDHLHTALTPDGAVWLVSKNSIDSINYPQLVLRVRSVAGRWSNFLYSSRTALREPSRPVITATPGSGVLLAGHTVYNRQNKYKGSIEFGEIDTAFAGILKNVRAVIAPEPSLRSIVNDATVPRNPFPANGPWLILASDAEGRIYEADLRPK